MSPLVFLALVLISLVRSVSAMWPESWIVGFACGQAAQPLFPECGEWHPECFCKNDQFLASVGHCIMHYTHSNSTTAGQAWDRFSLSHCILNNEDPGTDNIIRAVSIKPERLISDTSYKLAYTGEYHNLKQKDVSSLLAGGIVIYWLGIMGLASLKQFARSIALHLGDRAIVMRRPSRSYRFMQKYILLPSLFRERHMQRFRFACFTFSMGTRFETLVILGHIALSIIFMLTPYTFMDNDPLFKNRWAQMLRYASDRSGIMGTIHIPLFVLFALRNNVLIWLTGWSYATFNVYHRAIARVSYALLIVHAITKHIFSASYGASLAKYFYPLPYYRWGVCAMGLFAIMIASGSARHSFYELFLWIHILCAIAGLICTIFHLRGIGYQQPVYVCFGIWAVDRLLRLLRILALNFSVFLLPIKGAQNVTIASLRVYNREFTSVTVSLPVRWHCYPGQFVYLHMRKWKFLAGHPFSVLGKSADGNGLELICKARSGLTKRLLDRISRGRNSKATVFKSVTIEGPYGQAAPVGNYDEGIFIAGGIGITGVLQYIEHMLEVGRHTGDKKHILLIWTVRKKSDFHPLAQRLAALTKWPGVNMMLFCRVVRISLPDLSNPLVDMVSSFGPLPVEPPREGKKSDHKESASESTAGSETCSSILPPKVQGDDGAPGYEDPSPLPTAVLKNDPRKSSEKARLSDMSMTTSTEPGHAVESFTLDEKMLSPSIVPVSDETNQYMDALSSVIYEVRPEIGHIVQQFFTQAQGSVCVVTCGPDRLMDATCAAVCRYLDLVEFGRVDYYPEAFGW